MKTTYSVSGRQIYVEADKSHNFFVVTTNQFTTKKKSN